MNNLTIDDAYISNIKSMFKHLDDEIIWSAIYHHGFGTDGNFNEENVIKADIFHPINTQFAEISKHSDRLGFVIVTSDKGSDFVKNQADHIINKYYPDFEFV